MEKYAFRESAVVRMLDLRRFPLPLSLEEPSACFVVRDHNGHTLSHVYFADNPQPSY
jgi:hypothetical protein